MMQVRNRAVLTEDFAFRHLESRKRACQYRWYVRRPCSQIYLGMIVVEKSIGYQQVVLMSEI